MIENERLYERIQKRWCESAEFDEETKSELISIMGDEKKLKIDFIKN